MRKLFAVFCAAFGFICLPMSFAMQAEETTQCPSLTDIQFLPFKGENTDPVMLWFMTHDHCDAFVLNAVTSEIPMQDPRETLREHGFVEGDMAVLVLWEKYDLDMNDFLPENRRQEIDQFGVYAYFAAANDEGGREVMRGLLADAINK